MVFVFINVILAPAKTASEMFFSMPDSLLPYMDHAQRTELLGMKAINPDSIATLPNGLGQASVTLLTQDRIFILLTDAPNSQIPSSLTSRPSTSLEIGRINDNKFVVIKTYSVPEKESTIFLCDSLWQNVEKKDFSNMNFFSDSLLVPAKAARLTELRKMVEFPLVEAHLTDTSGTIVLNLNAPFLSAEDKATLRKNLVTKTVNLK